MVTGLSVYVINADRRHNVNPPGALYTLCTDASRSSATRCKTTPKGNRMLNKPRMRADAQLA